MSDSNENCNTEIPYSVRNCAIVRDITKSTFNFDHGSTDKARSAANNVCRGLVKKKVLMLGSKEIDTINNSDICDTYKNFYLSQKEGQENCFGL